MGSKRKKGPFQQVTILPADRRLGDPDSYQPGLFTLPGLKRHGTARASDTTPPPKKVTLSVVCFCAGCAGRISLHCKGGCKYMYSDFS